MTIAGCRELERKIIHWSHERLDILATVVIGSYARLSPAADEFSDLDLVLFTLDPGAYTTASTWLHELGELWIATLNYIGPGDPEWLALFDGGTKADFLFVTAEPDQSPAQMLAALPYQDVLARGARVIYSRGSEHQKSSFSPAPAGRSRLPSEQMFEATVNRTLFAAERLAKFIRRGEFWRSGTTAKTELGRHLLTLIEWHAQSSSTTSLDTWYDGRYMEQWADARVLDRLRNLDLGYRMTDQDVAVQNALELIEWLASQTAARLGYSFPSAGQAKTLVWLNQMSRDSGD